MNGLVSTIMIALLAVTLGFFIGTKRVEPSGGWALVYAHDESGAVLEGAKDVLLSAIRDGKPVRVYWAGSYVEHATDSFFLTIIEGEVFAQISSIRVQRPTQNPPSVALMAEDQRWATIFSTNGDRALKWFVQD